MTHQTGKGAQYRSTGRELAVETLQPRLMMAADIAGCEIGRAAHLPKSGNAVECTQSSASATVAESTRDYGPTHRFDVNLDGVVDETDVQPVMDYLNTVGPGTIDATNTRFDVSGDRRVSPVDALQVINYLRSRREADAEQTRTQVAVEESTGLPADILDVDQSGSVNEDDAALVFRHLENHGATTVNAATARLDTNRDGRILPLDVLLVINAIRRRDQAEYADYVNATELLMTESEEAGLDGSLPAWLS